MRETWYVLEDNSVANPNECAPDKDGVLRHKGGQAVAKRGDAYSSRGVDLDDKPASTDDEPPAKSDKANNNRQMKAKGGKGYETR